MYVCEWDMCWRNFCNASLVTKNVKRRSKIARFFIWAPFWNLISKKKKKREKETIPFFWSKLSKLHKKDPILHVTTSLKQGETRTNSVPIPHRLTGGNWQNWKRVFLTCHCHKIYRDEAVGLKSCKNTWKITIFVKMWNLGQYRENLIFCQ